MDDEKKLTIVNCINQGFTCCPARLVAINVAENNVYGKQIWCMRWEESDGVITRSCQNRKI